MDETAVSIVVPTYDESGNLPALLERIDRALPEREYEVVVVDDDSPDRTWEIARRLSEEYPVTAIRRTAERGLATAVVEGFDRARGDVLAVMDADLQHPPEKLPALIDPVSEGSADLVVGSRLVETGSFGDFSVLRQIDTHGANALAKVLFPALRQVSDIQSGFFALRRAVIDGVDLAPRGYKILLEILVRGEYDLVSEVGYRFRDRKSGESNLDWGTMLAYLRHLAELRWGTLRADR
jgi:dolichol-phosphate mannosyltransferase